jgi:hypothetical protein
MFKVGTAEMQVKVCCSSNKVDVLEGGGLAPLLPQDVERLGAQTIKLLCVCYL